MSRDMTVAAFRRACERYGFEPQGFLGYYRVTDSVRVSVFNAGPRRRDQLAYLIREKKRIEAIQEEKRRSVTPSASATIEVGA